MTEENNVITIQVLDRKYNIKCPAEEASDLQEAAKFVNDQMKRLRQTGNMTSTDQLAVVTALNVCHELFLLKKQKNNHINMMNQRLQDLQKRIEKCLDIDEKVII